MSITDPHEERLHEIGLISKLAARNDEDAVTRLLFRKYRMELFRFGVHVLGDQGLAEEMVQETFIKFCRQASNYDASRGPVRGLLFTMARSVASDIARRPSSRPFLPVENFQPPPQYDGVDEALTVLTVDVALDKLPSVYADVMRLVRDGLTPSEIAERLGIPVGTVKSRTAEAAGMLRAELAGLRGDDDALSQTLPDSASGLDNAREQGRVRRVAAPAAGLLGAGARLFPAADRARYDEEYRGELWDLAQSGAGRIKQLRYALHQLLGALPMSFTLRYPRHRSAAS
jgi:RNA polymerase sigma-70 factor (ECF subfamily)